MMADEETPSASGVLRGREDDFWAGDAMLLTKMNKIMEKRWAVRAM